MYTTTICFDKNNGSKDHTTITAASAFSTPGLVSGVSTS